MVLRVLGVLALVIGAIFAAVMLLVLLPFLDNFNMSLLVLAGVFGVLAYVFLAIGWQLFHPPEGRGAHVDEPPAAGDDEGHLAPTGEGTIGLASGVTALAEAAHVPVKPVVAGAASARALEPEARSAIAAAPVAAVAERERDAGRERDAESERDAQSDLAYAEMEYFAAPGVGEVSPPEPEPVLTSVVTDEPDPAPVLGPVPSALVVVEPPNAGDPTDGDPTDGDSTDGDPDPRPSEDTRPSVHRVPDRRARSTFKKRGAALPRR